MTPKRKFKVVFIPLAIIIIFLIIYALAPKVTKDSPNEAQENSTSETIMTLDEAFHSGLELECTWDKDAFNFGKAYIKDAKVYTETVVEDDRHMMTISDACVWRWQDGEGDGTKECQDPTTFSFAPPTGPRETQITYSCKRASIADTLFEAPSGVRFLTPEDLF